jgi:hypothetical protein
MVSLAGRVAQVRRDLPVGGIREYVLRTAVRRNFDVVYPSQGSFSRRYDCSMPRVVLRALRLSERESFYRSLPSEPAPLKPWVPVRQDVVPEEWTKENREWRGFRRVPEAEVAKTFVDGAWTAPLVSETKDEYWRRVRDGSFRFVPFEKKTYRLFRKFVGRKFTPLVCPAFRKEGSFWAKKECEGDTRGVPVAFVRGEVLNPSG